MQFNSLRLLRIGLLDLLDDLLDLHSLSIVDTQVVLIVLQGSAHTVKSLRNFASSECNERLSEEALGACIVVAAKLFPEPVKDDCKVFLCLVIEDRRDIVTTIISWHYVSALDYKSLPDLNDLLEEGLGIDQLPWRLEELAHVEIALAQVDALRTMFHTFLIDSSGELFERLLEAIWTVLGHEKATEGDV